MQFLPAMYTDISMRSAERTLIIDTKYYLDALSSKYGGKPKVSAENLYQIHAYLSSLEGRAYPDSSAEGLLLYPANGYSVDLGWNIRGHIVRVKTLDLGCHWRIIHNNLLEIVGARNRHSVQRRIDNAQLSDSIGDTNNLKTMAQAKSNE